MAENWKSVAGFEGLYDVSDMGQVRSYRRQGSVWNRRKEPMVLKPNFNPQTGYLYTRLYLRGTETRIAIHKLVLEIFIGSCPFGCEACHNNGDRTDNRVENLRWDTHLANMAQTKGRKHPRTTLYPRRGENHHRAKLTNAAVVEIREARRQGVKIKILANKYGVSESCISCIANGKRRQSEVEL